MRYKLHPRVLLARVLARLVWVYQDRFIGWLVSRDIWEEAIQYEFDKWETERREFEFYAE